MLEFTGKEDGYQDLLDGPLNGNDRDHTQNRMGRIPEFKEPLKKGENEKRCIDWTRVPRTKNSKNAMMPMSARKWAIAAMIEPNLAHELIMGPRNREMKKKTNKTVAFHTIGPRETTPIRIKGLGG